eukprot:scaffold237833_cov19-Tisochrysis_lutea.AAC.1
MSVFGGNIIGMKQSRQSGPVWAWRMFKAYPLWGGLVHICRFVRANAFRKRDRLCSACKICLLGSRAIVVLWWKGTISVKLPEQPAAPVQEGATGMGSTCLHAWEPFVRRGRVVEQLKATGSFIAHS